ncbi:TonB-dependent receptor [Flavobacterium sp. UBA7680]|uniref:TonB-dependent receptor n=1 Tax=Flavobacterium sp. UBA7680 TaxID=1946559 RepID=UPI0025C5629D|nr:TonB-dependent receptor [Flavobacterium sp. UBA7680]
MILKILYLFLFLMLFQGIYAQNKFTISGYISEKGSKENLPGVTVYVPKLKVGTASNNYGFYSITLPKDSVEVIFSYVGFKAKKISFYLDKNISFNVEMGAEHLQEVTVSAEQTRKISEETQMSSVDIPIEQIKQIPALMGEKDVLKVIQLMPGVQKGSEGSTGIYVRGGGPDQNLIILDEAPVYNANHLFGFFSVFNGDALKSVELIKGGFPARYGGRLSSVIDLQMKDGNKEKIHGEAGIGLIAARLTLEGPIIKNKCSFLISGRRTYIDALVAPFLPKDGKLGYYFYDINAKINYVFNDKNRLYLSGYFGQDKFYLKRKTADSESMSGINWGNATSTLRWNHLFNSRLFSNLSFIFTNYKLGIENQEKYDNDYYNLKYTSNIRDFGVKYNFDFMPHPNHYIRFGANATWHHFIPQALVIKASDPVNELNIKSRAIDTYEGGIFIEDDWRMTSKLKMNIGFRLSALSSKGNDFFNPEPRAAVRYFLGNNFSLKGSYAMMNQYLHLLSSTGIGLPTDLWVPATNKVKPQQSQQVALGLAKDLPNKNITITVEGYYKWMKNVLNYKEGANFLNVGDNSNPETQNDWQTKVVSGTGLSYGAELLIQKKVGKFTGWIGYTLSWTWLQFDSLNFGERFPARYDRRHDISVVGIYKINDHITLSATWVYGTGNAITLPIASYGIEQHTIPGTQQQARPGELWPYTIGGDYGKKNSFRMSPYHRMDIGIQFHKKLKRCVRTFEVSLYNVYSRQNPFFYYISYDNDSKKNKLMQASLFPILPSVSWSYKF